VGTNDAKQERSLEQTLLACEAVLEQCRVAGRFAYLGTLPGKNGCGTSHEPWSMNAMIEKLNKAYRSFAREQGIALVELSSIPPGHFVDGIHLTQAGSVWVGDAFAVAIGARRERHVAASERGQAPLRHPTVTLRPVLY
jgi:lysophospholipase L1-like esterase